MELVHIPPKRRELYLRVLNNAQDIHPITHRLHFLDDHFPPNKIDTALTWLINNNFIGASFIAWWDGACKKSDLEMHRLLLAIVDNVGLNRIVMGQNFK